MNKPKYLYKTEDKFTIYEFVSEGPKGRIKKMVEYTETATENVYNLGFGDFDETTNAINDLSVTNNGDSLKVLATVASTVYAFIEKHPNAYILATGSTNVRTRLYRMGITINLALASPLQPIVMDARRPYPAAAKCCVECLWASRKCWGRQ